jgi:hypothetical protein
MATLQECRPDTVDVHVNIFYMELTPRQAKKCRANAPWVETATANALEA